MFSEPMIIYYLQLFKDTYWPNGQLPTSRQQRSDEEKLQSRFMAKEKFNTNIPGLYLESIPKFLVRCFMIEHVIVQHQLSVLWLFSYYS